MYELIAGLENWEPRPWAKPWQKPTGSHADS
jgi:hypothetical protein